MAGRIPARTWQQYLEWAEDYFLFPNSRTALLPVVAFSFDGTSQTIIVRNKSSAQYTGASIRALLIRITDSGQLDGAAERDGRDLPAKLDLGTCVLEFWDDENLAERWPEWKVETKQIGCSSQWYTRILGWSDQKIKDEFGLASSAGPEINFEGTP
ncbi:hypothetical protein JX266_002070 [Neoarthrinium moseri]|nr:hypothetical protein JX266_002070 [Neoarthrinium moseri]